MKRTRNLKCKDKKRYEDKNNATNAMNRFYRDKFGGVVSPNVSVYPCGDHYHWGHSRDRKK